MQEFRGKVLSKVGAGGCARDQQPHRRGHEKSGDGGHQAVANGQDGEGGESFLNRQVVIESADQHTAHQIDNHDDDGGHAVAFHKLAGAVHGTVEISFALDFFPTSFRFIGVDVAGRQV